MPLTSIQCPNCDGVLHTDDLLEGECVTPGCGLEFTAELYRENNVRDFYIPEEFQDDV